MFDIFYTGAKPNLFEFEQPADSLDHAAELCRTGYYWYIYGNFNLSDFDFNWRPAPWELTHVHVWASQWQPASGICLAHIDSVKQRQWNFRKEFVVKALPYKDRWQVPDHIDSGSVDYSWHPNPIDPPYIYHFPSQWQSASGVTYTVPGATEVKLVSNIVVKAIPRKDKWITKSNVIEFDYSWHPNPLDPVFIHEFATQWHSEGGPVLAQEGANEYKYHSEPKAHLGATKENWKILHTIVNNSFDFSWTPHPKESPYIYVWGNQHWPAEKMPTVEYHVPGAVERKYMDGVARLDQDYTYWVTPDLIDDDSIDYSWVPDPGDPPYIYEFATQWQPNGGACYVMPGATERKYIDHAHRRLPNKSAFKMLEAVGSFDYSWHPSNTEEPYIYVFGNQHWPATIMPTITYTVEGATKEKFIDKPVAKLWACMGGWEFCEDIDDSEWDWTWVPNPKDPPYIYVFGNQWNPPEFKASLKYHVEGATEVKYMARRTCRLSNYGNQWRVHINIEEFDYSWEPNPFDPPYIYVFGNQWNSAVLEPTVEYHVEGATEVKYVDEIIAKVTHRPEAFELLDDIEEFDYSWRPNPTDPPYIYVFGNQWLTPEQRPALQYRVGTATEIKYMDEPKAKRKGAPEKFKVHYECTFDYSWEPDPGSPPYIYIFGNQWHPAEIMPTVEYHVEGATEIKYMSYPQACLLPSSKHWVIPLPLSFEFDESWCPDPGSPPYIYVFGNQWHAAEEMSTIEYHVPGATERKFINEHRARLLPIMDRWSIPEEVDTTNIDFSWHPHPKDLPYVYHFGTEYQMSVGLTYTVPGATELKFWGDIPVITKTKKVIDVVDIFFVDRNNSTAQTRFERLQAKYPNIQKIRYANSILDTINRCATRAKTNKFWVVSSEYDYSKFDFAWHAQPWQSYMTHVFPSQHNKWSDTFLINKWEFERHIKWAKHLEEFPNLNFVQDQKTYKPENLNNIFYVDHGNIESREQYENLREQHPDIVNTRFVDNYLDTMKRIVNQSETEYVWICNSVCDYTYFDFTWQPEPWQKEMIHCFSNGTSDTFVPHLDKNTVEIRGDTFYIHVESFKQQMVELELLDWFNVINYVTDLTVRRWYVPSVFYTGDNLIEAIKNHTFEGPYAMFSNRDSLRLSNNNVCLWTEKDRVVRSYSADKSMSLVPRDVKKYIKTQMYDYPHLDTTRKGSLKHCRDLDIIFISNGEPDEEKWFDNTVYQSNRDVKWIRGVNGRVAAYQAAANASETDWFFAVFAKLEVLGGSFPWEWQPDYWQTPKHYIFNARNPVNDLEYGHMGIIAYNKRLVLTNNHPGIDFTLSQPHESVPILSGTAHFNQDPWTTWRTAFREVLKLRLFMDIQPTLETEHRFNIWCKVAKGAYSEYSLLGARDAVDYYKEVNGNLDKLKLSFEWAWLKDRFTKKNL